MKKLLVILLLSLPAFSQGLGNASIKHFSGVPSGSCNRNTFAQNDLTGFMYSCDTSQNPPVWAANPFGKACDSSGNCVVSGTLNVTGLATLAGGAVIGPGYADDGTPAVAFAAKLSGANLIKAVTGDQYAHNIVLTTLRAAGNFSYTAVPGQQYACRSQGTTTAGHWFGVSGTTAAAWVDLGAVGTSLGALSQPAYGVVIVGAADGANATCLWTDELSPMQALLGSFTRAGDLFYCSAVSSTHCTALSLLAGNNSGTQFLSENSSGVPAWSTSTSTQNICSTGNTTFTLTGGADKAYTCTIPSGTFTAANQCLKISGVIGKNAGANSTTYSLRYGDSGTALAVLSGNTSNSKLSFEAAVCTTSSTAAQIITFGPGILASSASATLTGTSAVDGTLSQDFAIVVSGTAADVINFYSVMVKNR